MPSSISDGDPFPEILLHDDWQDPAPRWKSPGIASRKTCELTGTLLSKDDICTLSPNANIYTMLADDDNPMLIRTPNDLGAIIRNRRKQLGLGQAALAQRIEVSRQWIIGIERGHSRAELGLVLRALDTLGIRLETHILEPSPNPASAPDLDAILMAARKVEP